MTDPMGRTVSFNEYDVMGNPLSVTDLLGHDWTFAYDATGHPTSRTDPLGHTTAYEYDGNYNLTAAVNAQLKRFEFQYDAHNNLIRAIDPLAAHITADYDGDSNPVRLTDQTGRSVFAEYDFRGRVTATVDGAGNRTVFHYNGPDQPWRIDYPNGTVKYLTWDARGRLVGETIDTGANEQTRAYAYDAAGNLTAIADAGGHAYQYDLLDRLVEASSSSSGSTGGSSIDESYTYDADDNLLTSAATSGAWTYNANNQLTGHDDTGYQYDAAGNLIRRTVNGTVTSYEYAADNRLARVWNGQPGTGTLIAAYHYDPFGRRLWKEVDGVRTNFLYSDEGLIGEYDAAGTEIKTYGWRPDTLWGTDPLFLKTGGLYYWYQNDHLGTPQKLILANGLVAWDARYDAFGGAEVTTSGLINNLRFPGMYADPETGLYYNCHRYYDPAAGRYITADPLERNLNLYAYCYNNPGRYIDPFGLCELKSRHTALHNTLEVLGYTPVFGNFFDMADMMLYLLEGNLAGAGFSLVSMLPMGSIFGTIGKQSLRHIDQIAGLAEKAGRKASKSTDKVKYIGKIDDLKDIPRNQTLLDDLPDLGNPRANWKQNSSVLRKAQRDGFEIRDASTRRRNFDPDPTRLRPDRKVGQSFLGAERNLLNNRGGNFDASRSTPRRLP